MTAALLLFLYALMGGRREAPAPAPVVVAPKPKKKRRKKKARKVVVVKRPKVVVKAPEVMPTSDRVPLVVTTTTAPVVKHIKPAAWPQPRPDGLPTFPGPGWVPASPPTTAIQSRAAQLLSLLWKYGEGTAKIEKTGAEWIAYRASMTGSKRGVTAWRLKQEEAAPAPAPRKVVRVVRASAPATPPPSTSLPTLRRGSRGPDVVVLQQRLGTTAPDGIFGPLTEAAVRSYQKSNGLAVDGIVGPLTWSSLFARKA